MRDSRRGPPESQSGSLPRSFLVDLVIAPWGNGCTLGDGHVRLNGIGSSPRESPPGGQQLRGR